MWALNTYSPFAKSGVDQKDFQWLTHTETGRSAPVWLNDGSVLKAVIARPKKRTFRNVEFTSVHASLRYWHA